MARSLLMIPGPVEVDGKVLAAMARRPMGHTGAGVGVAAAQARWLQP